MIAALAALLLVVGGQPVNDPENEDSTFSDRQPVRLAPLPAARLFAAFRDVCMATFPDPAGFDLAAAASDLGFVRAEGAGRRTREWSSPHGQLVFRQAPDPGRQARRDRREGHAGRERWIDRCEYWGAIEERMEPPALAAAIGAQLAPQSRPIEEILGFSWDLGTSADGVSLRLVYLPSADDPRLFTLSLQRLAVSARR